ncbi:MAG: hypothetical protein ACKKL4_00420 [Patescibacteria group bacterium]
MSDNKDKRGKPDSYLISFKQKYEVDYAVKQLQKQFENKTKEQVTKALTDAAKTVDPSRGRERIMKEARKNLRT